MSWEITYRKACVKLGDGRTLPILESGSNNCYEAKQQGRERRERSRGLLKTLIGTKESITPTIKGRVQRIIDDNEYEDYKEINESNRQNLNSKYWASRRFPGNINLGQVIKYLTLPNIDLDIADEHIKIGSDTDGYRVKPSEIDTLDTKNINRLKVSGVENALREQKQRRIREAVEKPKVEKIPGEFVIGITGISNGYIYKLSSRSLRYTSYPKCAKRFETPGQAHTRAKKMRLLERFSGKIEALDVCHI